MSKRIRWVPKTLKQYRKRQRALYLSTKVVPTECHSDDHACDVTFDAAPCLHETSQGGVTMSKKRIVTQKMWIVVTTVNVGDDQELFGDVVLLTPNKKKAERCVEVLEFVGVEFEDKPNRDVLMAKALKGIKGTVSYDSLVPYDNAVCFQRIIKE